MERAAIEMTEERCESEATHRVRGRAVEEESKGTEERCESEATHRVSGRAVEEEVRRIEIGNSERLAVRKIAEKKMIEGTNETKLAVSRKDRGDRRGRGP